MILFINSRYKSRSSNACFCPMLMYFYSNFIFFSQRRRLLRMADNSVLTSTTGRTSLADSSIFDSKVTEISKENVFIESASYVEGKPVNQL